MTIQRMDHVGVVVDDLAAATAFFGELGFTAQGEGSVEGGWVDCIVGLEGVQVDFAMMETPDGHGRLELVKFHAPRSRAASGMRRRTPWASAISRRTHPVRFASYDVVRLRSDAEVECFLRAPGS
jgi:catechol 2,3-dioxygenase-like lactoylglutathione lyase family enzyme